MKQNNALKSTAVALVMLFTAANENQAQGTKPGGFDPVAPPKKGVSKDTITAKTDTVRVKFRKNATEADTGTKKNHVTKPDMPLDDQARIYSRNNDAIGIAIFKGKDMVGYTKEQMVSHFEKFCTDRGVKAKVFIGDTYSKDGNTTYTVTVNGSSVGGIMNGDTILDKENGLPFAVSVQKGLDNRRRAAMSLEN